MNYRCMLCVIVLCSYFNSFLAIPPTLAKVLAGDPAPFPVNVSGHVTATHTISIDYRSVAPLILIGFGMVGAILCARGVLNCTQQRAEPHRALLLNREEPNDAEPVLRNGRTIGRNQILVGLGAAALCLVLAQIAAHYHL